MEPVQSAQRCNFIEAGVSSAGLFSVKLLRPMTIGPRRVAAGASIDVDADTAARLIRAGDAYLADDADMQRLAQHLRRW